ncbi:MAG TPA: hypothetical protein VK142_01695 [Bacillota bacterium]|nr:hypothetical protein [Bacillota bacterium]
MINKKYWLVDQVGGQDASESEYKEQFKNILDEWKSENVGYLSLLMNETYHDWLKKSDLQYVTSTVGTDRFTDKH